MSEWMECDERYAEIFAEIMTALEATYTTAGAYIWLNSRNHHLDLSRPIDLINEGRGAVALAVALEL